MVSSVSKSEDSTTAAVFLDTEVWNVVRQDRNLVVFDGCEAIIIGTVVRTVIPSPRCSRTTATIVFNVVVAGSDASLRIVDLVCVSLLLTVDRDLCLLT